MVKRQTFKGSREQRRLAGLKKLENQPADTLVPKVAPAPEDAAVAVPRGIVIGKAARNYLEAVQRRQTRRMGKKMNRVNSPVGNSSRKTGR
jgi:hypothetical protein